VARPMNKELKKSIRDAKASGSSIDDICETFGLSRNTIFYHLRTEGSDGRMKYSAEQRLELARKSTDELREIAARSNRSFTALQRVANRERKKRREDAKTRAILEDRLDFFSSDELKLFGFTTVHRIEAEKVLETYGLVLRTPNHLVHPKSGKWQPLSLSQQEALLLDAEDFLRNSAGVLKTRWREK